MSVPARLKARTAAESRRYSPAEQALIKAMEAVMVESGFAVMRAVIERGEERICTRYPRRLEAEGYIL